MLLFTKGDAEREAKRLAALFGGGQETGMSPAAAMAMIQQRMAGGAAGG